MLSRGRRRTLSYGLQTVLGLRPRGFFLPHRHAAGARLWDQRSYPALAALFCAAEPAFAEMLARIDRFAEALGAIRGLAPPAPRFEQDWFPRLDAALIYAFVRGEAPARVVEIGSGHSTRFVMRAVADGGLATRVTAIDPAPRADIARLPLESIRLPVQEADPAVFDGLAAGDLLLVDSSHILMPGTDVDIVLNRVLPAASPSLFVFFHDIFLPDPYPAAWPFTAYNEQNGVAPLLQGGWELVFASNYVVRHMAERFAASAAARLPIPPGARESGLLLRKR